jgi:CRP-like cAMP-binding protein
VATTRVVRSERFPDLGDEVLFPRLSDAKLAWLAKRGERRTFEPGEVLYEHAVRDAPFYVIEHGLVEFVDRKPGKDVYVAQADSRTFIGDIAAFTGEPTISACVAVDTTDVIEFDRHGLRDMVARWPEFGEHIFGTLLARRAWHEAEGHGVMRLIAARGSRRAFEVRDLLERNLLPVRWYDVDTDEESAALLEWLDIPRSETPVLVHAADVMRNPSAAQVARSLGLRAEVDGERFDLVVLGGGPAGLAAAVYGSSEGLRTLVAEAWAPGGQAGTSTRIENYLGFPAGISGIDLTRKATLQARRFDAVLSSFHRAVELADGPEGLVRVDLDDGQHVLARRGRDRRRGRQLGRAGGRPPRFTGAQRPGRGPRSGAEVDDVPLPRGSHRELAADRGRDRDRGLGRARLRHRGVREPAQAPRRHGRAGRGDRGVRDDRRGSVHRGGDGDPRARPRRLPAVRQRGGELRRAPLLAAAGPRAASARDGPPGRVRGRRCARRRLEPRVGRGRRRRAGRAVRARGAGRLKTGGPAAGG